MASSHAAVAKACKPSRRTPATFPSALRLSRGFRARCRIFPSDTVRHHLRDDSQPSSPKGHVCLATNPLCHHTAGEDLNPGGCHVHTLKHPVTALPVPASLENRPEPLSRWCQGGRRWDQTHPPLACCPLPEGFPSFHTQDGQDFVL